MGNGTDTAEVEAEHARLHPAEPRKLEVTKSDFHDGRFGSEADIRLALVDVRYSPKSGHCGASVGCPLSATSRHQSRNAAAKI
jgi:hypothetical protein